MNLARPESAKTGPSTAAKDRLNFCERGSPLLTISLPTSPGDLSELEFEEVVTDYLRRTATIALGN